MSLFVRYFTVLFGLLWMAAHPALAQEKNGFDLSNTVIPVAEILSGGPPRDGIPSIDEPKFEPASASLPWKKGDLMMTYDQGQNHYAFPIGILNWHEIVNHESGGEPVLISFCPLCGTGMAFDPQVDDRQLTFGVSGLLYNSDLLMYDHQTESLWSQIEGRAIAGPLAGKELEAVAVRHELWQNWRERVGDDGRVLEDRIGGKSVTVHYDPEVPSAELRDESGELLPGTRAFWFAWYTFHPETLVFKAK